MFGPAQGMRTPGRGTGILVCILLFVPAAACGDPEDWGCNLRCKLARNNCIDYCKDVSGCTEDQCDDLDLSPECVDACRCFDVCYGEDNRCRLAC